jgi:phosphoesterase RecJ-like protein
VEIAVMLVEKDDFVKGSLRSKKYVDVNKLAKEFGGGGHVRASGFLVKGSINDVKEKILDLIKSEVDE